MGILKLIWIHAIDCSYMMSRGGVSTLLYMSNSNNLSVLHPKPLKVGWNSREKSENKLSFLCIYLAFYRITVKSIELSTKQSWSKSSQFNDNFVYLTNIYRYLYENKYQYLRCQNIIWIEHHVTTINCMDLACTGHWQINSQHLLSSRGSIPVLHHFYDPVIVFGQCQI
jgi:hypothetical protein